MMERVYFHYCNEFALFNETNVTVSEFGLFRFNGFQKIEYFNTLIFDFK